MPTQLEKEFLQAHLAQVRQLLADARAHDDPIAEHQYTQRVARLERELAESSETVRQTSAGAIATPKVAIDGFTERLAP